MYKLHFVIILLLIIFLILKFFKNNNYFIEGFENIGIGDIKSIKEDGGIQIVKFLLGMKVSSSSPVTPPSSGGFFIGYLDNVVIKYTKTDDISTDITHIIYKDTNAGTDSFQFTSEILLQFLKDNIDDIETEESNKDDVNNIKTIYNAPLTIDSFGKKIGTKNFDKKFEYINNIISNDYIVVKFDGGIMKITIGDKTISTNDYKYTFKDFGTVNITNKSKPSDTFQITFNSNLTAEIDIFKKYPDNYSVLWHINNQIYLKAITTLQDALINYGRITIKQVTIRKGILQSTDIYTLTTGNTLEEIIIIEFEIYGKKLYFQFKYNIVGDGHEKLQSLSDDTETITQYNGLKNTYETALSNVKKADTSNKSTTESTLTSKKNDLEAHIFSKRLNDVSGTGLSEVFYNEALTGTEVFEVSNSTNSEITNAIKKIVYSKSSEILKKMNDLMEQLKNSITVSSDIIKVNTQNTETETYIVDDLYKLSEVFNASSALPNGKIVVGNTNIILEPISPASAGNSLSVNKDKVLNVNVKTSFLKTINDTIKDKFIFYKNEKIIKDQYDTKIHVTLVDRNENTIEFLVNKDVTDVVNTDGNTITKNKNVPIYINDNLGFHGQDKKKLKSNTLNLLKSKIFIAEKVYQENKKKIRFFVDGIKEFEKDEKYIKESISEDIPVGKYYKIFPKFINPPIIDKDFLPPGKKTEVYLVQGITADQTPVRTEFEKYFYVKNYYHDKIVVKSTVNHFLNEYGENSNDPTEIDYRYIDGSSKIWRLRYYFNDLFTYEIFQKLKKEAIIDSAITEDINQLKIYNSLDKEYKGIMNDKEKIIDETKKSQLYRRANELLIKRIDYKKKWVRTLKDITIGVHIFLYLVIIIMIVYKLQ